MDTLLIRTPHYYGCLLNTDTSLLWTPAKYGHLIIMDTHLIRTPHYYGHPLNTGTSLLQTAFSLGKESPYIFSKFDGLNIMDTLLMRTLSLPPYLSILGSFSIDDGDASENVTIKTNSRLFFSFRVYSKLLKISNAGQCPRVGFLGTVLKFRKGKKNS